MGNYKFFQNIKCEYFPCHKKIEKNIFNCLFCYCPLYALKKECGGNFRYTNHVKDCSQCILPHGKGAYDYIMSKIEEVIKIGSSQE